MSFKRNITSSILGVSIASVFATSFYTLTVQAQALEEIVVTAQRRSQNLQEVPISIDAISGTEIARQGFRNMDQLADFSPSILIDSRIQDQDVAIRGVGTTGNNLTLEQAAPTFVDGVHYGRTSQIKGAFIDLERIEVLRGPQPVYFGQNATAGAFSLITRKPGDEWEGNLNSEVGNFGRKTIEGGIGGPITDTLGIRVAGKWDRMEGYLTDVFTGDKFPGTRDIAGRAIVQWTPTEQFEATMKFQFSDYNGGSDGAAVALSGAGQSDDIERKVLISGYQNFTIIPLTNSLKDGLGVRTGPLYWFADNTINNADTTLCTATVTTNCGGNIDMRAAVSALRGGDITGRENIDPWDTYLNMNYTFGNDIELSSLTGFSRLTRSYVRENSNSPFFMNMQNRSEDYNSWSQEIRLTSPSGGKVEWMVGAYWQQTDLELRSDNLRAELRRPRRYNEVFEDAEWLSAFATLTYNFWDDKASIDLGARYTDIKKEAGIAGYSATWIFNIEPVSRSGYTTLPGGLYTYRYDLQRFIPTEWDARAPVGLTDLVFGLREGENGGAYRGEWNDDDINPQITLRYRPTDDISTYAKWSQAFKAGGFNTGSSTVPATRDQFELLSEYAENWEIGAKGTFMDGRLRTNASAFWMEVEDLQIATTRIDLTNLTQQGSSSTNAGKQRVRGFEFDTTFAATERLTLGVNGAIMDGKMLQYEGAGCTEAEFTVADSGPCISQAESRALTVTTAVPAGNTTLAGLIDRSGYDAPRTPDWVFTANLDYWYPVLDNRKVTFNGKFKISDGYITNVESFDLTIKMNQHEDMNLSLGYGDLDDVWRVSVWGRNLLEPLPSYNAEYDITPNGLVTAGLSSSHFRSYGVQFEYNYN